VLKRSVLVLAMVAVMVTMLSTPALASGKRWDCYKENRAPRLEVKKDQKLRLEDKGFRCYRVS
jgi:hypothetical protein